MAEERNNQGNNQGGSNSGDSKKGFASMPEDQAREIQSMGGKASQGGQGGNSNDDSEDEQ